MQCKFSFVQAPVGKEFDLLFPETRHLIVSSPVQIMFNSKTKTKTRFALFKKIFVRLRNDLKNSISSRNNSVEMIYPAIILLAIQ
ncbi:MAG: hypothetical protein ACK458_03100, partial [Sphingobacteriales bacterium]